MKAPTLTSFLAGNEKASAAFDKAVANAEKAERRRALTAIKELGQNIEDENPVLARRVKKAYAEAARAIRANATAEA